MQIVIDISEELYNATQTDMYRLYTENTCHTVLEAIKNGTVLPEGHGVLKDVTNLMRGLYEEMQTGLKNVLMYTPSDVYSMIDEECPTVIEAESENKEE